VIEVLIVLAVVLGFIGLAIIIGVSQARSSLGEWAVRYRCPGCDRRYCASHDNRFFLAFTVCPKCGTDKEEFSRDVCRYVGGQWENRDDAEQVAKSLMGEN